MCSLFSFMCFAMPIIIIIIIIIKCYWEPFKNVDCVSYSMLLHLAVQHLDIVICVVVSSWL